MTRYLCVHGHFYQPPRENAWLEAIERQDSAYPYHDWNARVTAESYEPNATSRILDDADRIVRIVNNYERISYNFGPTLLAWLEHGAPDTYAAVLDADAASRRRFSGHGNALAQAYNHLIMPLATLRDRRTQVHWGVADFRARYGREPEGMWLPETAVDMESLEALAEAGIRFTILAPSQARRIRPLDGKRDWQPVRGGRIDPTRAYLQQLPSGREIVIFFYDGPVSRAVAFEGLLSNGVRFAERLMDAFDDERDWPELVNIATDGETYGHHHRHGDMALAYALERIDARGDVELTNYGEYLERHPPTYEVEIIENTSWSCVHGVERWRSDCGCHTGGEPGWNQAWRAPLRESLDFLRDELAPHYEQVAAELLDDPWAARDDYIGVVLDRSESNVQAFLARHGKEPLEGESAVRALRLLELQRNAMLMYTSCGWFFNELSGIETVQVMQYAGRVVQLAREALDLDLETRFLEKLAEAKSNIAAQGDGRAIYNRHVRTSMVDPLKVAAHHAVLSLFEPVEPEVQVYCYDLSVVARESHEAGRARLQLGQARVKSRITWQHRLVTYGAVHFGEHTVYGGVREFGGDEAYQALCEKANAAFRTAEFPGLVRLLDDVFAGSTYSLSTLFRDEQRRIVEILLRATIDDAEAAYRRVYEQSAPLMRFVSDLSIPQPRVFSMTAELVLNNRLQHLFETDDMDLDEVRRVLDEVSVGGVHLDAPGLGYALAGTLAHVARRLDESPDSLDELSRLDALADVAASLPFEVRLWQPQNVFCRLRESRYGEVRARADGGDTEAASWVERFRSLGQRLDVRVDDG